MAGAVFGFGATGTIDWASAATTEKANTTVIDNALKQDVIRKNCCVIADNSDDIGGFKFNLNAVVSMPPRTVNPVFPILSFCLPADLHQDGQKLLSKKRLSTRIGPQIDLNRRKHSVFLIAGD